MTTSEAKTHAEPELALINQGGHFVEPVSCEDCVSACCLAGIIIKLSGQEAEELYAAGTEMEDMNYRPPKGNKIGLFKLVSDCGNLSADEQAGQRLCRVYGTEKQPRACREFPMGSYVCRRLRVNKAVDSADKFLGYCEQTRE